MRYQLDFNEAWSCRTRQVREYTEYTCSFCGWVFELDRQPDRVDGLVACPSCAEGLEEEEL